MRHPVCDTEQGHMIFAVARVQACRLPVVLPPMLRKRALATGMYLHLLLRRA